ncbi:MAG: hypothetical protein LAN37_02585 [Acidobacteriia bacterium]|jgi:hypothetical protein|nr:hypothetical protein [Terriglobia bacterium]
MQRNHKHASVAAAVVIGAGAAFALTSASIAMWLAAGAVVGLVLAAAMNNLVRDSDGKDPRADHEKLGAKS